MKAALKAFFRTLLGILPAPGHPSLSAPGLHLGWRLGWIRAQIRRPWWNLRARLGFGPRVIIGKRFSLQGTVRFEGPGTVIIGDDVIFGAEVTPFTHSRQAVLKIGSRSFINGTRFGCSSSIEIGEECILADVRIMDTDFHAVHRARNAPGMGPDEAPVRIGRNVWIAAGAAVLKGVEVGDDTVVAFGSVVVKSLPAGRIAGGNPARDLGPVPEGPRSPALTALAEVTAR